MAAPKTYSSRPNYRFLPADKLLGNDSSISFELDESDVWNSAADRSSSPEIGKKSTSRGLRRPSASTRAPEASSLPMNVPDWSKILKDEYRENRLRDSDDDYEEGDRIPPHVFLARQMARTRIASSSVHEGVGRTLKGRDLSRVRNAILQKTGGFNGAINMFNEDGWSFLNSDGAEDVVVAICSAKNLNSDSNILPLIGGVLCAKASMLLQNVPPAVLVRFLREHLSEWADFNMEAYAAASLKASSYA